MKVLVFAGAGASAELGVPAMREMVVRLNEHLQERRLAPALANKLGEFLRDPAYDIEQLIEQVDHMSAATGAFAQWGATQAAPLEGLSILRQEAEWFVNHMCERIEAAGALHLWGSTLDALSSHNAAIVTTNYDRAIEIAAARRNFKLYDGFAEFGDDEWTAWHGFAGDQKHALLKVHGSTDWYHSVDGDVVWKLRHPMPLFGRVTMQIDAPKPLKLRSAAILPSREKRMNLPPYPELAFEFRRGVDEAELAVFIGTSLRDPDMRNLYQRAAQRIPTFIVGRSVQASAGSYGASIRQTASKFLAATLPTALLSSDPIGYLHTQTGDKEADEGILGDLGLVMNTRAEHRRRCDAIERLAAASVALPAATIQPLLEDERAEVRTFALALVASCRDNANLLASAKAIAERTNDKAFQQELEILENVLRER